MGKHFVAETMRQLEQQARRQYREDEREEPEYNEQDFTDHATRLAAEARGFGIGEWA